MTACAEFVEDLPEFVLDTAPAEGRAAIVEHVASCVACSQRVAAWRTTLDRVVLLAPVVEPRAGFESRVLGSFERSPSRRHRRSVLAAAAAAILVGGFAVGALAASREAADDRRLASAYRAQLAEANGEYFAARRMTGGTDAAGVVFVYQGDPSWVVVTVTGIDESAKVVVTARNGQAHVGQLQASGGATSFGSAVPFDAHDITTVEVRRVDGTVVLAATVHR